MSQISEHSFGAGKEIYREGGPGDAIFIVTDGRVEVMRTVAGDTVRLTVLGKGAIFGESGVLRNTTRSTTVRALEPTKLLVIPKDAFLSIFQQENPLALTMLRAMCDRLAHANSQLVTHQIYNEGALLAEVARIRLLPDSREMQTQIGTDGLVIKSLPFRVGRHTGPEAKTQVGRADLTLHSAHGEEISPLQFSIEGRDGRLIVHDLESHLGTVVNGSRIAHFEESMAADLRFGATSIQCGGMDSPFRFQVIVERNED